jgi:low affinity Fe/Cu permease
MKWDVLILIGVLIITLIISLVIRNQKDKKDFEDKIKDDYTKPKHEHIDTDMDRKT